MRNPRLLRIVSVLCAIMLMTGLGAALAPETQAPFTLSETELAYLKELSSRPLVIAYSYDLLYAEQEGQARGMLMPLLDLLKDEFGLNVELRKLGWQEAFRQVESGEVDYYGPIALSDARRRKYITVNPFYRSYTEIVSRTEDPISSAIGLHNRKIGLLTGSVITRTIQTYLGPDGEIVYLPTMDDMIAALEDGRIDTFATVDNAEFEILRHPKIWYEFTLENFHVDQGLISTREELSMLSVLISRYIDRDNRLKEDVIAARRETILQNERERYSEEISHLREKYGEATLYAEAMSYPLFYLENGEYKGSLTEANQIFEEITGIPVRIGTDMDFPDGTYSAAEKLKTGECLALIGGYYNIDTWNDPQIQASPLLWTDVLRTYSYKDVSAGVLGLTVGAAPFAEDYIGWNIVTGNTPVTYNSVEDLISALKAREIDVAFMGEMAFNYRYTVLRDYGLREVASISAEAPLHVLYGAQNESFNLLYNLAVNLTQVIDPKSKGAWTLQADKYKSDYIRMRYTQQIWVTVAFVVFAVMLAALFYVLGRVRRAYRNTAAILGEIPAPICVIEAETGVFMDVNAAFSELCGDKDGNMKKTPLHTLLRWHGKTDILEKLRNERNFECIVDKPDGSAIEVDLFSHPFLFWNRRAIVVHCVDLTRQKTEKKLLSDAVMDAKEKNKTIMDSIYYAGKIQSQLLPANKFFENAFSDYAILWKPRDIVGGDIYWLKSFSGGTVLCVCDCTGHGVPGALLTMLVASALEAFVNEDTCGDPALILRLLDLKLASVLNVEDRALPKNRISDIRDGCDLAVLFIAKDGEVVISAANTNVFICDGKKVDRIKGKKLFIGEGSLKNRKNIELKRIPYRPENKFYIASDGLFDQIGGETGRPFGYKAFKRIIVECHSENQAAISEEIWRAFEDYRGEQPRRDDLQLITFQPRMKDGLL